LAQRHWASFCAHCAGAMAAFAAPGELITAGGGGGGGAGAPQLHGVAVATGRG